MLFFTASSAHDKQGFRRTLHLSWSICPSAQWSGFTSMDPRDHFQDHVLCRTFRKNLCSGYLQVLKSTHKPGEGMIISLFLQDKEGIIKSFFSTTTPQQSICTLLRKVLVHFYHQTVLSDELLQGQEFILCFLIQLFKYLIFSCCCPICLFLVTSSWQNRKHKQVFLCLNPHQVRPLLPLTLGLAIPSHNLTTAVAQDLCKNTGLGKKKPASKQGSVPCYRRQLHHWIPSCSYLTPSSTPFGPCVATGIGGMTSTWCQGTRARPSSPAEGRLLQLHALRSNQERHKFTTGLHHWRPTLAPPEIT